jgi:hypothetical protein
MGTCHLFTRRELYERVWAEPISALAKTLQVSDVWLAKICRLNDIPLPPRGYFAKFGCPKGTDFFVRVRREVAPVIVSARKG